MFDQLLHIASHGQAAGQEGALSVQRAAAERERGVGVLFDRDVGVLGWTVDHAHPWRSEHDVITRNDLVTVDNALLDRQIDAVESVVISKMRQAGRRIRGEVVHAFSLPLGLRHCTM